MSDVAKILLVRDQPSLMAACILSVGDIAPRGVRTGPYGVEVLDIATAYGPLKGHYTLKDIQYICGVNISRVGMVGCGQSLKRLLMETIMKKEKGERHWIRWKKLKAKRSVVGNRI